MSKPWAGNGMPPRRRDAAGGASDAACRWPCPPGSAKTRTARRPCAPRRAASRWADRRHDEDDPHAGPLAGAVAAVRGTCRDGIPVPVRGCLRTAAARTVGSRAGRDRLDGRAVPAAGPGVRAPRRHALGALRRPPRRRHRHGADGGRRSARGAGRLRRHAGGRPAGGWHGRGPVQPGGQQDGHRLVRRPRTGAGDVVLHQHLAAGHPAGAAHPHAAGGRLGAVGRLRGHRRGGARVGAAAGLRLSGRARRGGRRRPVAGLERAAARGRLAAGARRLGLVALQRRLRRGGLVPAARPPMRRH